MSFIKPVDGKGNEVPSNIPQRHFSWAKADITDRRKDPLRLQKMDIFLSEVAKNPEIIKRNIARLQREYSEL